ncbi:beta-1,3-galactosyltransferase 2-like [Arapaima gigas]
MDSYIIVKSKGKSEEGRNVVRSKWRQICVLSIFLLLSGSFLALNYISLDFYSFIVKTWTRWFRADGQEWDATPPWRTSPPTTLLSTTQTPWKPLGPFEILYPHSYHFILDEQERCKSQSPFLVLMVPVAPHNWAAREAIRQTWGNETLVPGVTISRFFLLGQVGQTDGLQDELKTESNKHHDLLQANFLDTYLNLTIKTMLMMEWLVSRCPNAIYAAKVDTDMFLNVDFLVNTLLDPHDVEPKQNYITGSVIRKGLVQWQKSSKWYVPKEVYPQATYPDYVSGNTYVFSMDLPAKFLVASQHIRAFHLEDVYLGMCLEHLGLKPTDPPKPNFFYFFKIPYNRCKFADLVSVTGFDSDELDRCWNDFQKPGLRC